MNIDSINDSTLSPALSVENLSFAYEKGNYLFKNLHFQLEKGQILQILGANGAGKTTLLNCLARQLHPKSGVIRLFGRDLRQISRLELAQKMAYVPQLSASLCRFKVIDYTVMGRTPHLKALASPGEADYGLARRYLADLRLSHLAEKTMDQLSGGERQQVQIARALTQQSPLILLDEPANHLDYGNQHRILGLMTSLAAQGYTLIATTHMPDAPLLTGGFVGIFAGGQFLFGPSSEMLTGQTLEKIYGIQGKVLDIPEIGRKACFCLQPQANSGENRKTVSINNQL
ncbi:MAG: ABC transporter ATP-binding protein [Firmicutes bacterium]|nr:ABC transporter ATP-binding protein [Bacillota bacterium]